ncbi:MAG: hypothetical protein WBW71_09945 [Bacteroidota bacterium]
MKIFSIQFFSLLALTLPLIVFAQEDSSRVLASIDMYTLNVEVNEEHHNIQGEAQMELYLLKDSVSHVRFTLATSMMLIAVRDSAGKKIEVTEESPASDTSRKEISVPISDTLKHGTTLFFKISYEETFDTVVTRASFINPREILLSADNSGLWWPILSPATNPLPDQFAPVVFNVTCPSIFTVVSNGDPDSMRTVGSTTTQRFMYKHPMDLKSCFLLCASSDFLKKSITNADSTLQFSLFYNPKRFSTELADTVLQQLRNAYSFFSSIMAPDEKYAGVRMVMIGDDDGNVEWFSNNGLIVGRNSYLYSAVDPIALTSTIKNKWVHELTRFFRLAATDSTFLFDESWSHYLTAKFFLAEMGKNEEAQQRIRLGLLSTTLDFYPAQTLAQDHRSRKNEQAVFFSKGAYVFLMLEYVIGEEAFNAVTKNLYQNFRKTPVTIPMFQQLCEEAYGSPLDWFFKEWVYQTGFPELILSTDIAQTNRGNYSLNATITQRGDLFTTPVDLVFSNSVRSITRRVFVEKQDQEFKFILPFLPTKSELDPKYYLLRWVPQLRLLAHARTSVSFRVFDHDLVNSEREANGMLQLDPNNLTGWTNLALFSLGKSAVIKGDLTKAEEYFRRASALDADEPTQLYSVLSLVRLGNVLEMEGKRDEAVELYKLGITLAGRNPALYGIALREAQKYLQQKFVSSDDFWYGEY